MVHYSNSSFDLHYLFHRIMKTAQNITPNHTTCNIYEVQPTMFDFHKNRCNFFLQNLTFFFYIISSTKVLWHFSNDKCSNYFYWPNYHSTKEDKKHNGLEYLTLFVIFSRNWCTCYFGIENSWSSTYTSFILSFRERKHQWQTIDEATSKTLRVQTTAYLGAIERYYFDYFKEILWRFSMFYMQISG